MYLVFYPCCISAIGSAIDTILLHGRAIEKRKVHPDLMAIVAVVVIVAATAAIRIRTATSGVIIIRKRDTCMCANTTPRSVLCWLYEWGHGCMDKDKNIHN